MALGLRDFEVFRGDPAALPEAMATTLATTMTKAKPSEPGGGSFRLFPSFRLRFSSACFFWACALTRALARPEAGAAFSSAGAAAGAGTGGALSSCKSIASTICSEYSSLNDDGPAWRRRPQSGACGARNAGRSARPARLFRAPFWRTSPSPIHLGT